MNETCNNCAGTEPKPKWIALHVSFGGKNQTTGLIRETYCCLACYRAKHPETRFQSDPPTP